MAFTAKQLFLQEEARFSQAGRNVISERQRRATEQSLREMDERRERRLKKVRDKAISRARRIKATKTKVFKQPVMRVSQDGPMVQTGSLKVMSVYQLTRDEIPVKGTRAGLVDLLSRFGILR